MRSRFKITPAMAVACLALFVSLSGGAYAAFKLKKNSVTTKALKNGAVTTKKIANGAVTGPKIAAGTLTGQVFKCGPGDVGLGNRQFCAFKITTASLVNWFEAIQMCRARGSTPATLPTAAELMAFAPLGGSPFKGPAEFWTSDIASGNTDNRAWIIQTDANGNIAVIDKPQLTAAVTNTIACVYHAADVS